VLPSLLRKTVRDWRRAGTVWAVGLAGMIVMYLSFWIPYRDDARFLQDATASLPEAVNSMFGMTDIATGPGWLQSTVYSIAGPLLVGIAAIGFGARAIAGPEDLHVMDLYLANPISRRSMIAQRAAALVVVVGGLGLVTWVVVATMAPAVRLGVGLDRITAATVHLLLLALFLGMLALAAGAVTGRRGVALAVAGSIAGLGYVWRGLADSVAVLHPWRWLSPFQYDLGADPLHRGLDLGSLAVLLIGSLVLLAVAVVGFDRRDVRA